MNQKLAVTTLLVASTPALLWNNARADNLPPVGEWDGVTAKAKLTTPYEDPRQIGPPFGIVSYFNQPWRSYVDTWPARRFLETPAANWNIDNKYADAIGQLLDESGIRSLRIEIGWGNLGWDDDLPGDRKANLKQLFQTLQKHHIRPMILLNAHHGVPCPMRDVNVELVADAKKGDTILKFKPGTKIREGYTGPPHSSDYIAAYPLITKMDEDGTAHLSAPLPGDHKAGSLRLQELKYRPFQGVKLKNATPEENARIAAEAQETADGWMKYAASVARLAREAVGTPNDSGFDLEVWNEQTFGANFLNINNYYEPKLDFEQPFVYRKTRALTSQMRPDARTNFQQDGAYAILPMTIDYFNDAAHNFKNVKVVSGFANQWPWDSGTALWDGQAGFSRHYYTGGWQDISADKPLNPPNSGVIDALGNFEGQKDNKDWHTIMPGTKFVPPLFRVGMPEYLHTGFKTESLSRDVMPDSRFSGMGGANDRHGRYTHNGDFRPAEVWQTEVNYWRAPFIEQIAKETNTKQDDPRILALSQRMAGKTLLRQYLFHNHKGLSRIYMFALADDIGFGMLPKAFYQALDKNNLKITPEVRAALPPEFKGMVWLTRQIESGDKPETLIAPRPLRVDGLVEYKPRLAFAGDGTAAHPHQWHRDWFAFLPYQAAANKFIIPYYVVTLDMTHVWDAKKDALDPARYDMPEQEFDVTIGNCAGQGATVSAYDPLSNSSVPGQVVAATANTLTVRLKAVDYPRVLLVNEARPGPQILDPKVSADASGLLTIQWRTNVPVNAVKVTYGRDWTNRGANEVVVAGGESAFEVKIPTGQKGVLAARIRVAANGLTDVWPRWDEDPQGQVVVPGSTKADVQPVTANSPTTTPETTGPMPLTMPAGVNLTAAETNATRGFSLRLPTKAMLTGPPDDREGSIGNGANAVRLRVRYLPGAAKAAADYLPFAAPSDFQESHAVVLPNGSAATLASYTLSLAAHPGMTNLRHRYLLVPIGKDKADLLLLAATGTLDAFKSLDKTIQAIFSSVKMENKEIRGANKP